MIFFVLQLCVCALLGAFTVDPPLIHAGGPFSLFPLRDRVSDLLDHI